MIKGLRLFRLLDWYLFVQLLGVVLFAVVLFSLIWLAPETLFKLTQSMFGGELTWLQGLWMFALHIPAVLQQTIPVAVLVGCILLFQRLSQNYEVVAILVSGVSPARMLVGVLWIGVLFGVAHAVVQEVVLPYSAHRLEQAYMDANIKEAQDRNFLFVEKNHQGQLNKFFMIGQIQKPELSDFIILYYQESPVGVQISRILRSKTGRWIPESGQWQLLDGIEYVLNEEGVYKDIRQFAEQQIRTDKYAARLLDYSRLNPEAMPWGQLRQYIKLLREGGQLQDVPYYEVRLWQKWAGPVATMVFAVLGALLGLERVRSNRTYGLTFGALVIFVYSILVPFTNNMGALDVAAPWLVAWLPLLLTVGLVAILQALRPNAG